jgi:transposase
MFALKTGIPWASLPVEMGCGSGMTCWRRLRDWQGHRRLASHLSRIAADCPSNWVQFSHPRRDPKEGRLQAGFETADMGLQYVPIEEEK